MPASIGVSNQFYVGINSKASASSANFDKIYMYKYTHTTARYMYGKMLAAPGELAILKSMVIDTNGD
jgi:hypothetical protein